MSTSTPAQSRRWENMRQFSSWQLVTCTENSKRLKIFSDCRAVDFVFKDTSKSSDIWEIAGSKTPIDKWYELWPMHLCFVQQVLCWLHAKQTVESMGYIVNLCMRKDSTRAWTQHCVSLLTQSTMYAWVGLEPGGTRFLLHAEQNVEPKVQS